MLSEHNILVKEDKGNIGSNTILASGVPMGEVEQGFLLLKNILEYYDLGWQKRFVCFLRERACPSICQRHTDILGSKARLPEMEL